MRKTFNDYVSSCDACQKYNYKNIKPAGKLISTNVTFPLGIGLIGPYPLSNPNTYRFVLEITDYFCKWVEFAPLRKASAHAVATAFFESFISRYSAPVNIVFDHGPQFISAVFKDFCRNLEIKHVFTVPYRPQSNQAERVNRTLIQMISAYIKNCHDTWNQFIQQFAFALRSSVLDSTGKTPAELFLGRNILMPLQRLVLVPENKCSFMCQDVDRAIKEAQANLRKSHKQQKVFII